MASPQSSQPKRPSQLSRSVSKAFRTLGTSEKIQCTKSLIQAYNDNDDEGANGIALHQWLEAYIAEFSKHKAECVSENWIREYALLATINVKDYASVALVRRVYVSLRACIKPGEYCSPVVVVALDDMLRIMDSKIVAKEAQSLVSLANDLLCMTDPKKCIFTRDTYESHMSCLLTLERILIVLHGVECTRSKQRVVDFFQTKLRTHLKSIVADQNYYPFVYSTQLIKYNIDNLIKGGPTATLLNAGRRAFYAICGGLYLFQGVRELAVMRLDFAAMEAGVQKMQQAFSGMLDAKAPGLQEVIHAASKSEATKDFSHIMDCYTKYEHTSFMAGVASEKLKIVKFAVISHLTLFASESSVDGLSNPAFDLLSNLAVNDDTSQWRANSDIYECLLDALASISAKKHTLRQDCLQLLQQMENSSIQNQQTVKDWRGNYSIEQKLDINCDNDPKTPTPSLYDTVRKQLELHLTHTQNLELKRKLIEYYQDERFVKVSLLIDDVEKRHITDCDFHIVVYELVDAENRFTNNVRSTDEDQMAHNVERSRWIQTPIKLKDVFAKRRQKPSGPKEEVNCVLLLGNPGTGKTSLSKRLCHDWTTGEWGSEFDRVYFLQVRQLTGNRLHSEKTLEGAISTLLFNAERRPEEERRALNVQIEDELAEHTTLLVLDGLDEASGNDAAEAIVRNALSRTCSVLVLSRPHNLGDLHSKVDTQIECLGLNDDQLKAYVRKEVPDDFDELVQFLKKSTLVWETAKIPINAQILCTLWNSDEGQSLKESKSVNLKSVYSTMIRYAWKRFVEKEGGHRNRDEVFSSLEIIAFKSISRSKVEIPLDLVTQYSQGSTTDKLFCDSGFLLFHKEGQVFQFAHLSFHEFFAGRFLAKSLQGTSDENSIAKKYIAERKYYDTSRVTLSFMTQCYCQKEEDDDEKDCIDRLKHLLSILDEDPVEVIGFQHTLLKMRTLDSFLSVCGSHVEEVRSDKELHRFVQSAIRILKERFFRGFQTRTGDRMHKLDPSSYAQIMEDLEQMPSLFVYLPEFWLTALKYLDQWTVLEDTSSIARLASHAPEQLLGMTPSDTRLFDGRDVGYESNDGAWFVWLKMFAEAGPECAVLALEQLKTACQDQNIRGGAFKAVPYFLKALSEQEDLHSLCIKAMKDTSVNVRARFLEGLREVVFEPNSVAANLAWTLTVEATRDDDKDVRIAALRGLIREDQTSEASIEKMIEILKEFRCRPVWDIFASEENAVCQSIHDLLRRCPTQLKLFLPFLASCCFCDLGYEDLRCVAYIFEELSLSLPTPQKRELGEMISRIYCDVEDPEVRRGLVAVLYDIAQKVPDFTSDFRDVFAQACNDTDNDVSGLAKVRKTMSMLTSVEGVDAINEVFWDRSVEVKKDLLRQIQRESMINAETAGMVMEMAADCMGSSYYVAKSLAIYMLSSVARFRSLSNETICGFLDVENFLFYPYSIKTAYRQPLYRLIECYWATKHEKVILVVASKFMMASVTYKAVGSDKSILSIVERGKKTELEASTKSVKKLFRLVKHELRKCYGDLFSETWYGFLSSSLESVKRKYNLKRR